MTDRVFILGLGAPRSGTTWLHSYLSSRKGEVDLGFAKEYHHFDTLYGKRSKERLQTLRETVEGVMTQDDPIRRNQRLWRKLAFLSDPNAYPDYFSGLISRPGGPQVTGDLTPANWILPARHMAALAEAFASRGVRVVPVFLMRDPVERLVSSLRHTEVQRRHIDPTDPLLDLQQEGAETSRYRSRSWYPEILQRISDVFGENAGFVGFYETLFSEAEVARLCATLGLPYATPDFETRVNSSSTATLGADEALKVRAANYYRPSYDFMAETYGSERMRALWPGYAYLD